MLTASNPLGLQSPRQLPAILLTPDNDAKYGEMEPQSLAMTRSIGDFYLQVASHGSPSPSPSPLPSPSPSPSLSPSSPLPLPLLQTFGVTWKPDVQQIELADVASKLEHVTFILCSDGIWDLWEYATVPHAALTQPSRSPRPHAAPGLTQPSRSPRPHAAPGLTQPSRRAAALRRYEDVFQSIVAPPAGGKQSTDVAKAFFNRSVTRGTEIFDDTADNMTGMVVYLNPRGTKLEGGTTVTQQKPKSPEGGSSRFSV